MKDIILNTHLNLETNLELNLDITEVKTVRTDDSDKGTSLLNEEKRCTGRSVSNY